MFNKLKLYFVTIELSGLRLSGTTGDSFREISSTSSQLLSTAASSIGIVSINCILIAFIDLRPVKAVN